MANPQSPATDEHTLLVHFKKTGDLEALGTLFSPYAGMLYGVCMKYLRDRDDARDAVMQVFEKLVTLLRAHQVDNFKSWLYVTARNHCLMQIRANKGKTTEDISTPGVENALLLHPESEPDLEEDLTRLEHCIGKLNGDQQICVRSFFLDEKSYKDICEMTGFDLNKVKSHLQNGKRNLKICIERNG